MQIVFIGTGEIGLPTLRALLRAPKHQLIGVVTQPDKPVGREQRIQPPPIKAELATLSVPVFQPVRIRNDEVIAKIRGHAPDVIVVMAYGQILPKSVLAIPRIACLNLHASLLPRYRGAAPIQAAIVAGDRETGITIIYMDEGLDTGDMLLQTKLTILPDETGGSLHDRLAQAAPEALLGALDLLAGKCPPRTSQQSADASNSPKLTREDGQIDWSEPAELIERKIRAFDPWPGTFAELSDAAGKAHRLKIFRALVSNQSIGDPGTIVTPNDEEVLVATGRGALCLDEVQLEGRRRMRAADFLRGFSSPRPHF
jgi:methionyl-tRNA formyltransferase